MFQEPIEEKFNDLLKQRIALEGELALSRHQAKTELAKAKKKNKHYLLLLIVTSLLALWFKQKADPSVYLKKIGTQRDSISLLQKELTDVQTTKKDSTRYVIKSGDMLVTIGIMFFNDSTAGYQIGRDNGIVSQYQQHHLNTGDTLTIYYR